VILPLEILPITILPATALPASWLASAIATLLVFMFPWGLGIPVGVLMARDAGLNPAVIAALYFMAYSARILRVEAGFFILRWLTARFQMVRIALAIIERMSGQAGLDGGPIQKSLLTMLMAFAVSPTAGRVTGALAGFSLQRSWALTIAGDMVYFTTLMGSTLWLSETLANDRLVALIMVPLAVIVPIVCRKVLLRKPAKAAPQRVATVNDGTPRRRGVLQVVPALATIALLLSLGLSGARA
jgi:hypothetical protein